MEQRDHLTRMITHNPHTVRIAPTLYDRAYDQLARPYGLTVEQAVNQLLAANLDNKTPNKDTKGGLTDG